jgi:hypothetical protein
MALCLAAGAVAARLPLAAFTLAWTHSVERIPWEEDWRVEPAGLVLVESRVRGSGAGMEPGPGARLLDGAWRWRPDPAAVPRLVLARAPGLEDWRLCTPEGCRPLGRVLPGGEGPVALFPCPDPPPDPAPGSALGSASGTAAGSAPGSPAAPAQATGSNQSGVL